MLAGSSPPRAPEAEYEARLAHRRAAAARLERRSALIAWSRLAVFALGAVAIWLAFVERTFSAWWTVLPALVFVILVIAHERVERRRRHASRGADYYQDALDRIARRPRPQAPTGERFLDPEHPYAGDLDLFGRGSIFELISTARTHAGEAMLARWFLHPATSDEINSRHGALTDLRDRIDFREDLWLIAERVVASVDFETMQRVQLEGPRLTTPVRRSLTTLLAALNVAALSGWAWFGLGPFPFLLTGALGLWFASRLRDSVRTAIAGIEPLSEDLTILSQLLERIERESFESGTMRELHARLQTEGLPPSDAIRRLERLVNLLESRRNQLFAPIAAVLLWTTHLAFAIERWRERFGPAALRWVSTVAEIEALCSIANFAWEHPSTVKPVILEGEPRWEGEALGHPLIPPERLVRNDVTLGRGTRLLIVSGSNMSGKSTLLRTVGVNTVLALAGAPVLASQLRLTRLELGASIQIRESLQEGKSRFYAEISRLRQLMEMAGRGGLLFLVDEILHGTNSHDRKIGAEAILRGLVSRGAIGLVTTHDLAIASVEEELAGLSRNVHFEDHIEDGRMVFDYRIHEGVVTHSNAIALMREIGLEV